MIRETDSLADLATASPAGLAKADWQDEWSSPSHIQYLNDRLIELTRRDYHRMMVWLPPRHGKQCAHSTPVLSSSGWTVHGSLSVGDRVFSPDGHLVSVMAISDESLATMEVVTTDGEVIKCHENHEWRIYDKSHRKWRIMETKQLAAVKLHTGPIGSRGGRWRYQLPLVQPLQGTCDQHSIDPYCLGVWLGDGSRSHARITYQESDRSMIEKMHQCGMEASSTWAHKDTGVLTTGFAGWYGQFRRFGAKRIPGAYLSANMWDRLQLLAGLIDTDGYVDHKSRRVRFCTCEKDLADDVAVLVRTFGWRASIACVEPRVSSSGIVGKKPVYQVGFSPDIDIPCALSRKQNTAFSVKRRRIGIKEVRAAKRPEKGHCIQVEGGEYLVGRHLIPTHNSTLIDQFFIPWYLGHYPNDRVMLIGYGHEFTKQWSRKARDVANEWWPRLWPQKPRQDVWSASEWGIQDHEGGVVATGVGGQLTGRGANVLIIDDPIKSPAEAVSEVHRQRIWDLWQSVARIRLEPDGIIIVVQTRWHVDDLSGRILSESSGTEWKIVCLRALAEDDDPLGRELGEPLWPERFGYDALESIRSDTSEYYWQAQYQQRPTKHESVLWPSEYFDGDDMRFVDWPKGIRLKVMTLDPSKGKGTKSGDYSAYVLLGIDENGRLWVEADLSNTRGPRQIVEDGVRLYRTFGPNVFGVEAVAFQDLFQPLFEDAFHKAGMMSMRPFGITHHMKKELRIERLDEWISRRMVKFRVGRGTDILINQLREFPMAQHDDGPDAMEMAIRMAGEWLGVSTEKEAGVLV